MPTRKVRLPFARLEGCGGVGARRWPQAIRRPECQAVHQQQIPGTPLLPYRGRELPRRFAYSPVCGPLLLVRSDACSHLLIGGGGGYNTTNSLRALRSPTGRERALARARAAYQEGSHGLCAAHARSNSTMCLATVSGSSWCIICAVPGTVTIFKCPNNACSCSSVTCGV